MRRRASAITAGVISAKGIEDRPERRDGERPQHHGKGKPRFEGKRGRQGHERFDQGERRERQDRQHERQPDPNSPFAKLAALKAQLEADSKERR